MLFLVYHAVSPCSFPKRVYIERECVVGEGGTLDRSFADGILSVPFHEDCGGEVGLRRILCHMENWDVLAWWGNTNT